MPDWHPAGPEIKEACRRAAEHCLRRGANLSRLAIQFSVSNPDLATTIVGTSHAGKIEQNVRWIEEPLDRELLEEVLKILEPVRNRAWQQGIPENYPVCVKTGRRTGPEGYVYTAEGPVSIAAARPSARAKPRRAAPAKSRPARKKPAGRRRGRQG